MSLWTVVPVKPFDEAKTRLAGAMTPEQRFALASRLFERTLRTALRFARERPVLVVTRSDGILRAAAELGAMALRESEPGGLNAALAQAAAHVRGQGGTQLLVVATDLPLLDVGDLNSIEASAAQGYAIAPDLHFSGTNALLLPASDTPLFAFGLHSYSAHAAGIRQRGADPKIVFRLGLALDIDQPEDLAALASRRPSFLKDFTGGKPAVDRQSRRPLGELRGA